MTSLDGRELSWIAPSGSQYLRNYYFRSRTSFVMGTLPPKSLIGVSAESIYLLYINGIEVGTGPARGTATRNYIDTYDIRALLQEGTNWIAVLVGCMNEPNFKYSAVRPALLVDSPALSIATDISWDVLPASDWRRDAPQFTKQMGFMEWRDLREEPLGWTVGKDDCVWSKAETVETGNLNRKQLVERDIPLLSLRVYQPKSVKHPALVASIDYGEDATVAKRMTDEEQWPMVNPDEFAARLLNINDVAVTPFEGHPGSVAFVVDFEREITGAFCLELEAVAGTIVDVGYEEQVTGDRLKVQINDYAFADRYILRSGRQTVGPTVAERGFRMIQVKIRSQDAFTLIGCWAVDRRYPDDQRASFVCSDQQLNAIWTKSVDTMSACTTDTFIDCPWRESSFWVNDLLVENVSWLQAFGDPRINAHCLRMAFSQPEPDGLLPCVCPTNGERALVFTATNALMPLMIEDYLMYSGDVSIVSELMPAVMRIFDTLQLWHDDRGVLTPVENSWNFVDWSYIFAGRDLDGKTTAVVNWCYVLGLESLSRLQDILSMFDDAARALANAQSISRYVDKVFWNDHDKIFADYADDRSSSLGSQLTHALALLSDSLPDARRRDVALALSREDLLTPELFMQQVVFRALTKSNDEEKCLARIRRYWGPIADSESATIWEANVYQHGKAAFDGAGSLCHGFATAPIGFFQTVILGVVPTKPGFDAFSVTPRPCGLNSASGTIPTPHGTISMGWVIDEDGMLVTLSIPENTIATLTDGTSLTAGSHSRRLRI